MEQLRAECTDRNHPCASEMREGTFMAALLSHQETETLKCPSGRNEKPNAVHTHSTSEAHSSRGMSRKDHTDTDVQRDSLCSESCGGWKQEGAGWGAAPTSVWEGDADGLTRCSSEPCTRDTVLPAYVPYSKQSWEEHV